MRKSRLIVITGLPATGKTTLARRLAGHYSIALLAKDTIKESLMDAPGSGAASSRGLSDLSFAILFALAREQLLSAADLIIEGNFRAGEHEPPLLAALSSAPQAALVQVLCRTDEARRRARLGSRLHDVQRHPGHRDAEQRDVHCAACDAFLELPGERLVFDTGGDAAPGFAVLLSRLEAAAGLSPRP